LIESFDRANPFSEDEYIPQPMIESTTTPLMQMTSQKEEEKSKANQMNRDIADKHTQS
jgi:hypothetical protein